MPAVASLKLLRSCSRRLNISFNLFLPKILEEDNIIQNVQGRLATLPCTPHGLAGKIHFEMSCLAFPISRESHAHLSIREILFLWLCFGESRLTSDCVRWIAQSIWTAVLVYTLLRSCSCLHLFEN